MFLILEVELEELFQISKIIKKELLMERVYNKLVRDNIPSIIESNGETSITRILSDEEYKVELERKLNEEYHEVLNASGKDRLEELADMIEIIQYLAKVEESTLDDIIATAEEKSLKRGAYEEKIFLEKVVEKSIKMLHTIVS